MKKNTKLALWGAVLAFLLSVSEADAATLTWQDNSNNEVGFIVRRKLTQFQPGTTIVVNSGAFAQLIQLSQVDQATYVDNMAVADINFDNEYCYLVSAYNFAVSGALQESGNSNQACLRIPRPVPPVVVPAAPGNLAVAP